MSALASPPRVYVSVVCDLFHAGHVRMLKAAKQAAGPDTVVVVGVCGDALASRKRKPIMNMSERAEVVRACRYVDEVVEDAPYVTTLEFLGELRIDHVVHGNDLADDQYEEFYPGLLSQDGMLIKIPYSDGISTASIIQRIQKRISSAAKMSEGDKSQPSRSTRWHDIWIRKGNRRVGEALHHVNGFIQLDDAQYAEMVRTVADPIGIEKGMAVLDCGCGAGAFLEQLQNQYGCARLAGVDYSESLIEVAKLSVESTDLHVGTICDLSRWGDESFDAVVCFSVYFYLSSEDEARQAVREAIRVCKKGGSVYIGDVSSLEKKELAMKLRGETHADQEKLSKDSPDHLYLPQSLFINMAVETGMENVRIVPHDQTKLLDFYDTAPYRFSVYMDKPAEC